MPEPITKKTYVLRLTLEVEGQFYIEWLDEKLRQPVDISMILTDVGSPLSPEYDEWRDQESFCDNPANYAFNDFLDYEDSMRATIGG